MSSYPLLVGIFDTAAYLTTRMPSHVLKCITLLRSIRWNQNVTSLKHLDVPAFLISETIIKTICNTTLLNEPFCVTVLETKVTNIWTAKELNLRMMVAISLTKQWVKSLWQHSSRYIWAKFTCIKFSTSIRSTAYEQYSRYLTTSL